VTALRHLAACLVIGWAATVHGQVPMTLTEADNGKTVTVRVGETVAVTLQENASTGYRWAIDGAGPALVTVHGPDASYPSGAVGSGGLVRWAFEAKAPGATNVALKRWRPWEGDASVVQRFGFPLSIVP